MIYAPEKGLLRDPSVFWHDGFYYAVMTQTPRAAPAEDAATDPECGFLARSRDGVHWRDWKKTCYEPYREHGAVFSNTFVGKVGDRFLMNHGVVFAHQNILRFCKSKNLDSWTLTGSCFPDSRWYDPMGRWDAMYVLPKAEENPSGGYWGFLTATPRNEYGRGFGLAESADGFSWNFLPPPRVEWDDMAPHDLEVGGVEMIGEKYVMIAGGRPVYKGEYIVCVLSAHRPNGPYTPDKEAFVLSDGATKAAWGRGKDGELLITEYGGAHAGPWLLPLRRPVFSNGHLRLGWRQENEKLKGDVIDGTGQEIKLTKGVDREMCWLTGDFDRRRGVFIEGTIRADPRGEQSGAGFVFEEPKHPYDNYRKTLDIRMEVGGPEKCETLTGHWNSVTGLVVASRIGRGHASLHNLNPGAKQSFKLLVRHDMFELYVDDLLVKSGQFHADYHRTGIGLMAYNCEVSFSSLKSYFMDLKG